MGHIRRPIQWVCERCGSSSFIENPDLKYIADDVVEDHADLSPKCRPKPKHLTFSYCGRVFEVVPRKD